MITGRLEWQPAGMREAFAIDLPAFFDDAFGIAGALENALAVKLIQAVNARGAP